MNTIAELWSAIEALGDRRSFFVLERYVPGDVYHVDSIVWEREVLYHAAHKYGTPPMNTAHDGGVFTTRTSTTSSSGSPRGSRLAFSRSGASSASARC